MNIQEMIKERLNGKFDHAYKTACKTQFASDDRAELCDVASVLLAGSGELTEAEQAVVNAFKNGSDIIPSLEVPLATLLDRGNFTAFQLRVIGQANRLLFRGPEPSPEPPEDLELLRQIAEAGAVVEAHRGLHDQAQERLMLAEIKRRRVFSSEKLSEGEKARAVGACESAKAEVKDARGAWERSHSALFGLQQLRERMRRAWYDDQYASKLQPVE